MKDKIVELLKDIHEAKEAIEINDLLGLKTAEEYRLLCDSLEELVNEFVVFKTKKNKYLLLKNCPSLKIGKISVNKKGFGFLVLDKEDDLYINEDNFNDKSKLDLYEMDLSKIDVKARHRYAINIVNGNLYIGNHFSLYLLTLVVPAFIHQEVGGRP